MPLRPSPFCLLALVAACATASQGEADGPVVPADAAASIDLYLPPPVDARAVDAAPIFDAPPADSPCLAELLGNGGFDSTIVIGPGKDISPWVAMTTGAPRPFIVGTRDELFSAAVVEPQAGGFAAWFGGADGVSHSLQQTVHVPANAISVRMRGYVNIRSVDSPATLNDHLRISLYNAAGTTEVELLQAFSEDDVSVGWVPFDVPVLGNFSGQTLQLRVAADTDGSAVTSFFVDTLSLDATICI